jgi:hypothetical protein
MKATLACHVILAPKYLGSPKLQDIYPHLCQGSDWFQGYLLAMENYKIQEFYITRKPVYNVLSKSILYHT